MEDPRCTWQRLFFDRAKHLKKALHPGYVDSEEDSEEDSEINKWGAYRPTNFDEDEEAFCITLWDGEGSSTQIKAKQELCDNGVVRLVLPGSISSAFLSGSVFAVAIHIERPSGSAPRILYSETIRQSGNAIDFEPYNRFEKFHAKSFFVGFRPSSGVEEAPVAIPCVKPSLVVEGKTSFLDLHLSWQLDNSETFFSMPKTDVLIFLDKGMTAKEGPLSAPTLVGSSQNWAMNRFTPRPLSSYAFLLDFRLNIDESLPCLLDTTSYLYQPEEFVRLANGACTLQFDVPFECQGILPTPNADWEGEGH